MTREDAQAWVLACAIGGAVCGIVIGARAGYDWGESALVGAVGAWLLLIGAAAVADTARRRRALRAPSLPYLFGQFYRQSLDAARGNDDRGLGMALFEALGLAAIKEGFMPEAEVLALSAQLEADHTAETDALLSSVDFEDRSSWTEVPDPDRDPEGYLAAIVGLLDLDDDGSVRAQMEADFRRGFAGEGRP